VTGLAEAPAALERGRPVLFVLPPAPARAEALWPLLPAPADGSLRAVILTTDTATAVEWASVAPADIRIHPVTSVSRTARLLAAGGIDVLAGTPDSITALAATAALKLGGVPTVIIGWPGAAPDPSLDTVLAEMKEARRMVLSWNPSALDEFCERHARRPHIVGDLPVGESGRPLPPIGSARFVVIGRTGKDGAVREALDALDAARATVWKMGDPVPERGTGPIVCADLPTRDELNALTIAGQVVVLVNPAQLPYLRTIAALDALPRPATAARGAARMDDLRSRIAARLDAGDVDAELAVLAPLLERYDAAEVAAAVLAVRLPTAEVKLQTSDVKRLTSETGSQPSAPAPRPEASAPVGKIKIHVNVGKKDRVAAKDLVGALIREVGLAKEDIGRIEVKETFCLVEIAAPVAERTVARFSGVAIRGRKVAAKLDR
jgi:hypothetical protein